MAATLTYTDANANVLDLHDSTNYRLRELRGAGIPGLDHHAVRTPLQDGETYIRTLLEPRFLIVALRLMGTSFENLQVQRRLLVRRLNPKLGEGTLKWKPDSAGVEYGLKCYIERGADFTNHEGPRTEFATLQLYCPDPTWYDTAQNVPTIAVTPTQLAFPVTFPIQYGPDNASSVQNNTGDVETWPVISNDDGAFSDPKIENVTTGKYLNFDGLDVASGETLEIDMKARTVELEGVSVLDRLTTDSEFWPLATGNNTVKITVPGSTGSVTWSFDWWTRFLGV